MVIGLNWVVAGRCPGFFRSWRQHTPPIPATSTTPRPPTTMLLLLPSPLEVLPRVVEPAGRAELSAGVVALRGVAGVDGATEPCCEEAAVGAGGAAWADAVGVPFPVVAGAVGVADTVGVADADGDGDAAVAEGEGEAEVGVGVGV